jgi:hypothetical protein
MSENRVETVANSLGMSPIPEGEELLRKEIRAELRDLHPDRNEGDFADREARERFSQLSGALTELDGGGSSTALVPLSTVAPMVTAIIDALGQGGHFGADERSTATQRQEIMAGAREEARHRFRLSRLGSGAVATFLSGLWMMPTLAAATGNENVMFALEASFVAPLFVHPLFEPLGFGVALYAWLFFGLTWFMEQNDLERIDRITTDEYRGLLLRRAVLTARQRGDADTVTKADLRAALDQRLRPAWILRLLGAKDVSASFLDRVATLHVSELVAQRVLVPSEEVGLTPRYSIDGGVAEAITG